MKNTLIYVSRVVFCEAYKSGLYGDKIQWLIVGGYTAHWWTRAKEHGQHLDCEPAEVRGEHQG